MLPRTKQYVLAREMWNLYKAELLAPNKLLGGTTKLQQWEVVFSPKNSPKGEGIENIDSIPSNLTKSLQFVERDDVIVKEVYEMLALSFKLNYTKQ